MTWPPVFNHFLIPRFNTETSFQGSLIETLLEIWKTPEYVILYVCVHMSRLLNVFWGKKIIKMQLDIINCFMFVLSHRSQNFQALPITAGQDDVHLTSWWS